MRIFACVFMRAFVVDDAGKQSFVWLGTTSLMLLMDKFEVLAHKPLIGSIFFSLVRVVDPSYFVSPGDLGSNDP